MLPYHLLNQTQKEKTKINNFNLNKFIIRLAMILLQKF
jgi:hypothetical protein